LDAIENVTHYNEALYEGFWRLMPFFPMPWWPVIKALADAAPERL
jgi:hypothetical protein